MDDSGREGTLDCNFCRTLWTVAINASLEFFKEFKIKQSFTEDLKIRKRLVLKKVTNFLKTISFDFPFQLENI